MLAEIFINQGSLDFEKDLAEIRRVKRKFAPFILEDPMNPTIRSYNPALARWNYERFGFLKPVEFKAHERIQLETSLGERFGVTKRPAEFINLDGKVYSRDFPNQPFDVVLQRGIKYRKEVGSIESEREEAELVGWIKIREKLLNPQTPLGSRFVVISGPGIVSGTMYPDNYIDVYESAVDFKEKKRIIRRKRFISGISYEDYIDEVRKYNSSYFDSSKGPIDAWFLENPIFLDPKSESELFAAIFNESRSKISPLEFEEILTACMPYIQFYINLLCKVEMNPEQILLAYNTIVVLADKLKNKPKKEKLIYLDKNIDMQTQIRYFGNLPIQNKVAGCGLSGGFNLNSGRKILEQTGFNLPKPGILSNSVAQFGLENEEDESKYDKVLSCVYCPECKNTVRAGIKDGCIHCLSCHASAPYIEPMAA